MTPEELFTAALGLGQQWRVVECRFEGEPKRLEHVRGQHFECPQCGTLCGVHDTVLVQIFLRVCFCPGEKALQSLGREDQCPEFRSGGCFSGQWFEVDCCFLIFSANSMPRIVTDAVSNRLNPSIGLTRCFIRR